MLKLKQVISIHTDEWIDSFQSAIALRDFKTIHLLLHTIPLFSTINEMKMVLLLSMDAEALLCDMRQELIDQKTAITTKFSV